MIATTALLLALLVADAPPTGRILLCRSRIIGDVTKEREGALAEAARSLPGRFLDYGVVCDDVPEAVRAARRARLDRVLTSRVEREGDLTHYVLSMADAALGREIARRELTVTPGENAVPQLQRAVRELLGGSPPGSPATTFSETIAWPPPGRRSP